MRTSTAALASVMSVVAGTEATPLTNLAPAVTWSARQAETFSDVLGLNGTDGSIQILTLTYDPTVLNGTSESLLMLGWFDSNEIWVNAIDGNTGTAGGSRVVNYTGGYAAAGVVPTAAYLGSWGRDPATKTTWAVIDHNSQFVVIAVPEPSALLLAAGGLAMAACRFTRRRVPAPRS